MDDPANNPTEVPARTLPVLEYRSVSKKHSVPRPNIVFGIIASGWAVTVVVVSLSTALLQYQWRRNVVGYDAAMWDRNEIERRMYEIERRSGSAVGSPPPVYQISTPVAWAPPTLAVLLALMTVLGFFVGRVAHFCLFPNRSFLWWKRQTLRWLFILPALLLAVMVAGYGRHADLFFNADHADVGWLALTSPVIGIWMEMLDPPKD